MYGLEFQATGGTIDAAPNRADVVCFLGFIARRRGRDGEFTPLSPELKRWLLDQGWRERDEAVADTDDLLQTPVPVESFEEFARLFAWETRDPDTLDATHTSWLGAAVRSFFAQGGLRCVVVRVGDPWPFELPRGGLSPSDLAAALAARNELLKALVPSFKGGAMPRADDRSTWTGLGVLHGLAEAAVVCLPDLPELVCDTVLEQEGYPPPPPPPEVFAECAPTVVPPEPARAPETPAPACTTTGLDVWFSAVRAAAQFLEATRRDVYSQLLLTVPLLARGTTGSGRLLNILAPASGKKGLSASPDEQRGIASRCVQLVYPWLTTPAASWLPGQLEPPDGALAGVLARSVSSRGAHRSLGRQELREVTGFTPPLEPEELCWSGPPIADDALIDRVTLLGPSPGGPRVLSDVTASLSAEQQPAGVERLTLAILRAAHRLGEELVFDANGPALWRKIRRALEGLLGGFYELGALRGASASEAFEVRCDDTTTTQADLDAGRVVAQVSFAPALPVNRITVVLTLREGGRVTVAGSA